MRPALPFRRPVHGFSLLEVLVALLVFSVGLIGLAGLAVVSVRANHGAYLRSQAMFLAENLANRMRANTIGIWQGDYDSTGYPLTIATPPGCTTADTCSPTDLATRDQADWSDMLAGLLPNGKATLACARPAGAATRSASAIQRRPPYDGTCTLRITWSEQSLAIGKASADTTFSWVFQP